MGLQIGLCIVVSLTEHIPHKFLCSFKSSRVFCFTQTSFQLLLIDSLVHPWPLPLWRGLCTSCYFWGLMSERVLSWPTKSSVSQAHLFPLVPSSLTSQHLLSASRRREGTHRTLAVWKEQCSCTFYNIHVLEGKWGAERKHQVPGHTVFYLISDEVNSDDGVLLKFAIH